MIDLFEKYTTGKKVLILGFGREGRSTRNFIQKYFPLLNYGIADKNPEIIAEINGNIKKEHVFTGADYLDAVGNFDVIIKSPGIKLDGEVYNQKGKIWLSQTGLFLERFGEQTVGITGTKGKSTTSSLIFHLLKKAKKKAVLVGNIGQPPLDLLDEIDDETHIVFELSANQLEHIHFTPHISMLLNLFPEHLDYFGSEAFYFRAKINIARFQKSGDYFIFDGADLNIQKILQGQEIKSWQLSLDESGKNYPELFSKTPPELLFEKSRLAGRHNQKNMVAAAVAAHLCGVSESAIISGIETFRPLPHRLEFVGNFCGIDFYNDSISTVPESTIEALKTIRNVNMLILGGFDRGIDYMNLLEYLPETKVRIFIFTGPAGRRMMADFNAKQRYGQQSIFLADFKDLKLHLPKAGKGSACLLSPAAPSYDAFKNFEERGEVFKKMAENLDGSCR